MTKKVILIFTMSALAAFACARAKTASTSGIACPTGVTAANHPKVPGIPVVHFPAEGGKYIGSPSICILPDGTYVVSHDLFGPKSEQEKNARTCVYASKDKGLTWNKISEINHFWGNLFWHNDALWIMGTQNAGKNCIIRKSTDGGKTWTEPKDAESGLLREGPYHTAPTPMLIAQGKIWRAMEHKGLNSVMFSADVNADLLKASSWTRTEPLSLGADKCSVTDNWLEGNAVEDVATGKILTILRVYGTGDTAAAAIEIKNEKRGIFLRNTFVRIPGASKKFTIRHDKESGCYWALVNWIPECDADFSFTITTGTNGESIVTPSESFADMLSHYADPADEFQKIIDSRPWFIAKRYIKGSNARLSELKLKSNGDGTFTDTSGMFNGSAVTVKYNFRGNFIRNTLALAVSKNLYDWKVVKTVARGWNPVFQAFQYPDWVFDGNDIIVASRTAWFDGKSEANNMHDANYVTFHRIKDFRKYAE